MPPASYPGWPLWFVGDAFIHTRRAGGLLTLGLLLSVLVPVTLPWLQARPRSWHEAAGITAPARARARPGESARGGRDHGAGSILPA